ncbi:MAG: SIS domain-containing protein [Deltaproteobacteria bacterium]|nr:SIS domain-containing protein [Deltaproteobacteria bacterium]
MRAWSRHESDMCGVIGLIVEKNRSNLGHLASELLRTLEYRGYDSTGAAFQADLSEEPPPAVSTPPSPIPSDGSQASHAVHTLPIVTLLKAVGPPSQVVHDLGITKATGRIFCGQVRWATFGAVDNLNAQPHVVACDEVTMIYGAHNGNIANCDELQAWLRAEHHAVKSDNDGEMVVHTIEHFFRSELRAHPAIVVSEPPANTRSANTQADAKANAWTNNRRSAMRRAISRACDRFVGSFAAIVVDPETQTVWAIKRGSSLYFGTGQDAQGAFRIASSDLSAVLRMTRGLVPMRDGEFIEYTASTQRLYRIQDGAELERASVLSRLRAKDAALMPPFSTFMAQEIDGQARSAQNLTSSLAGGSEASTVLGPYIARRSESEIQDIIAAFESLQAQPPGGNPLLIGHFRAAIDHPSMKALLDSVPSEVSREGTSQPPAELRDRLVSDEAGLLFDLIPLARDERDLLGIRVLDVIAERAEAESFRQSVERFTKTCLTAVAANHRIDIVCCGSSYHAAKAGAMFFAEIAGVDACPLLPGEFRATRAHTIGPGDVVIAVSQSGETKDLIDILNAIEAQGRNVHRLAIVNNINSTLAQEKCETTVPLKCGPEIAVPATKSFVNQLVLFFGLAVKLAEGRRADDARVRKSIAHHQENLVRLPELIRESTTISEPDLRLAATRLHLAPSIHILATRLSAVAEEGALKIREVVLNHTQGYEASEFKHGPNTILGFNTLFGPVVLERFLRTLAEKTNAVLNRAMQDGLAAEAYRHLAGAAIETALDERRLGLDLSREEQRIIDESFDRASLRDALVEDYPLIFVTGPSPEDVALTISQINTHKIRGASIIVIAEENQALRQATEKPPKDHPNYWSVFIPLPRCNDTLMTVFSSVIVLQRLALEMSLLKGRHLDELGFKAHGVHPDVPKNVSKSITVD